MPSSRVAGSLLHTMGLPELVTQSLPAYEQLALTLARRPDLLKSIKDKLKANRDNTPLFDTASFCRNLEASYTAMWRKAQLGQVKDELSA